ncbi:MAG: HlyD family efflux transporter periplasmic adaptor subunit, partial [Opitutaceae bacterium]|nr:HlyD family efflux transporter periplasmic adaptor subunit [Opitutaceae bacterium]
SLALTEQRLANAKLTAPFAGVVMDDDDLATKIGSPVRAGEPLYRLARLDNLIVDLQADERDFPYLRAGLTGEIAFASRPGESFPIRVVTLEPVATPGETGNTFLLRAEPVRSGAAWWRPGMTGVAKLDIGHRSLLWQLTHRATDWLRLKLWW